jgi:hypothetical protein
MNVNEWLSYCVGKLWMILRMNQWLIMLDENYTGLREW